MNYLHIIGMLLRQIYLLRHSSLRVASLFYWTTIELFLWGFITLWLKDITVPDVKIIVGVSLLGALIFWQIFYRAQQSVAVSFLEDIWSRNIINIFASPLTTREFVVSLIFISIIDSILAVSLVAFLAWLLYAFHIWSLGFYFLPFFINMLVFGWALGFLTIGLLIRFGAAFEILAWSIPVLVQPISGVFYPISILPEFWQNIAFFLPTAHLFEGMRTVILSHTFPVENILAATILNCVYFALSIAFFYVMLRVARRKGALSRMVTE
jgi:ABC-2 type transport system permease protein